MSECDNDRNTQPHRHLCPTAGHTFAQVRTVRQDTKCANPKTSKFKRAEGTQSMFSDHSGEKLITKRTLRNTQIHGN
jgi:hypothetical protein